MSETWSLQDEDSSPEGVIQVDVEQAYPVGIWPTWSMWLVWSILPTWDVWVNELPSVMLVTHSNCFKGNMASDTPLPIFLVSLISWLRWLLSSLHSRCVALVLLKMNWFCSSWTFHACSENSVPLLLYGAVFWKECLEQFGYTLVWPKMPKWGYNMGECLWKTLFVCL